MTLEAWLKGAAQKLTKSGVGTLRLDSLVLLEDELGKDKSWLLAHPEFELSSGPITRLNKKVARRAKHEPLAYIRGFTEFYGRRFSINKTVLEPRPESETMIDLLLELSKLSALSSQLSVLDVGTGSGALAITAKLELPKTEVVATDLDPRCLKVARQNANALGAEIKFIEADLLDSPEFRIQNSEFSVVLANLPYVPDSHKINQAAAMEPRIAIFGGKDGLELYRRLFPQLAAFPHPPTYVLTEAMPPQQAKLVEIAAQNGYKQLKNADFIQLFRLQA